MQDNNQFIVNLANLQDIGDTDQFISTASLEDDQDIKFIKPIEVTAMLSRIDKGVLVDISIKTSLEVICSRCAKQFTKPINLTTERIFEEDPSADYRIESDLTIDLEPIIREEIILNQPIKNLCNENCKGIAI